VDSLTLFGFNIFLHEEQNTYLTFTEFEAISPLFGGQTYLPIPPPRHYLNLLYFYNQYFKELLQYKYNKNF
jgi:hypothetical protein